MSGVYAGCMCRQQSQEDGVQQSCAFRARSAGVLPMELEKGGVDS